MTYTQLRNVNIRLLRNKQSFSSKKKRRFILELETDHFAVNNVTQAAIREHF